MDDAQHDQKTALKDEILKLDSSIDGPLSKVSKPADISAVKQGPLSLWSDKIGVEGCTLEQPTYKNPDGRDFAGHCAQACALLKPLSNGVLSACTS
jgi:hypothetical protein